HLRFGKRTYIDKDDTLNYRIAIPDIAGYQNYPVVIYLHGAGERGGDNVSQLIWGAQSFASDDNLMNHKPFVIAPQAPPGATWSNFEGQFEEDNTGPLQLANQPSRPLEMTMAVLDKVIKKFAIDTTRIYISGMSMGGYGTW